MKTTCIVLLTLLGWSQPWRVYGLDGKHILQRQDTQNANLPTLTTEAPSSTTNQATSAISPSNGDALTSIDGPRSSGQGPSPTSTDKTKVVTSVSSTTSSANAYNTAPATVDKHQDKLPLNPEISPVFGTAGVLLILLGAVYALIGVKSKWVQIFLSSGFIASIATTALIVYVMDPPVRAAIQGGYFVAIVMTGVIFGAGSLVFKEFTGGFGCLLGGFCFSMWLLTLRSGGLVRSSGGKGVFIGVFCLAAWALSWTHYTRTYGLIVLTSFGGATAFMLGIDCFSRAGMKEFWVYILRLNGDLFPLNTNTYPQTRGIRVEIAIVVIGTIIGLLSQIKLWRVIRSNQREIEVMHNEEELQNDEIETALGRHLQLQNERETSVWERHYGDRRQSPRKTMLWQHAHPEKHYSHVSVLAVPPGASSPPDNLEMNVLERRSSSSYGSKHKRQNSITAEVIVEVEEDSEEEGASEQREKLEALEESQTRDDWHENKQSLAEMKAMSDADVDHETTSDAEQSEVDGTPKLVRRPHSAFSGLTKRLSPGTVVASESREHLLAVERPYSRASSAAATLDTDNEELNMRMLDGDADTTTPCTWPEIVISPATPSRHMVRKRDPTNGKTTREEAHASSNSSEKAADVSPVVQSRSVSIPASSPGDTGSGMPPSRTTKMSDEAEKDEPRSHRSEGASSSVESLTQDALAQVPSQLSSVVLSYRTNEWAKHIAAADVPIYDEPETIDGVDEEPPTHLASFEADARHVLLAKDPNVKIQAAGNAMSPVKAGVAGVGIAFGPGIKGGSLSDQERRRGGGLIPSRSGSMQGLRGPSNRSSRNSLIPELTTSLITTPIDENSPTEFPHPASSKHRASASLPYTTPFPRRASAPLPSVSRMRPGTAKGGVSAYEESIQESSQVDRPVCQSNGIPGASSGLDLGRGTGTRPDSYNSRQPPRADSGSDVDRRQSLLAEWRLSQQYRAMSNGLTGAAAEAGRAHMRAEKENQRLMEEYQRVVRREKQYAIDQAMRRPHMQQLHREAMRRMQAGVNHKLRPSSG
ncbi:hypothetical protein A1O1_04171 [Capronia coronata CBS 617.96]|uniref:TM7S3/TM198-like domain-containing protein n=1 Tax=Capronia coronata CBS 617.96 TaxID=1182541 RepID=W9Z975_9EURO|nr:uncharacterized protein A1O1_04171 [Capronia coronata CBS 617.96]EXJ91064.1 hypothetical protein A1O1_04171 [Capronia coronata CBS 617.96]